MARFTWLRLDRRERARARVALLGGASLLLGGAFLLLLIADEARAAF